MPDSATAGELAVVREDLKDHIDVHRGQLDSLETRMAAVEQGRASAQSLEGLTITIQELERKVDVIAANQETNSVLVGRLLVGIISATVSIVAAAAGVILLGG